MKTYSTPDRYEDVGQRLYDALDRCVADLHASVQGKPVRDMAEALAESHAALAIWRARKDSCPHGVLLNLSCEECEG